MNITIYHNPRCRKSREALNYIIEKKLNYTLIKYLEEKFNSKTLSEVLMKLKVKHQKLFLQEYQPHRLFRVNGVCNS